MIIERQLATLRLIEENTANLHLAQAARRKRAELMIEKALEGPAQEDRAEENRLAAEAHGEELSRMAYERNQRVQIVTQEPHRGS